jgi:hypothetical protein
VGLKEIVKRLEQQANATKVLCPHLLPLIHHADGSIENESTHDCGRPRLEIIVSYSDGSDPRMKKAAHDAFAEIRREFGDLPPSLCAESVCRAFGNVTPSELLERAI